MARLFGTNGIRWRPDRKSDPNFTVELGLAIGSCFGKGSKICMGMDTRVTGPAIKAGVSSGLMAAGCDIVDIGIVPTPTVQHAVRKLDADGGVMISASHNPPEFNGLKCIDSDGTEMAREKEEKIEDVYFSRNFAMAPWDEVGKVISNSEMGHSHIQHILSLIPSDESWKGLKVVVDCSNGPAGNFTPGILARLGCEVLTINAQPDGMFPGREPEPLEKNLGDLMAAVVDAGADLGIAHDGDADRAVFIDEKGRYVTGDESLAIFSRCALRGRSGKVVVPVNTSKTVTDIINTNGGEVELTPIGSPIIARHMGKVNAILGGEGNGGVIFPENMLCRDGMMTAARMIKILATTGKNLSAMVEELPKYAFLRSKFECPDDMKERVLAEIKKVMAGGPDIIDIDGVKIEEEDWWVLLRPSGTEPIFRVTAEAKDGELARVKLDEFKRVLEEIIHSLS